VKAASSSEHWKVELGSFAENVKVALVLVVELGGPVAIVVSGAVKSIVQEYVGGLGSTLPARSIARTANVWRPALRLA
jgi:adenine deaminase